jgi:hypothetical protein
MAKGGGGKGGCAAVEINGRRVSLSPDGLRQARGHEPQVGKKLLEAVRAAADRARRDGAGG